MQRVHFLSVASTILFSASCQDSEGITFDAESHRQSSTLIGVTSETIPLDRYTHVAVVKQGASCSIYLNGVLSTTFTCVQNDAIDGPFSIGSRLELTHRTCKEIKATVPGAPDGIYSIDLDGPEGGGGPFQVYCDMSTAGGGWTRVVNAAPVSLTEVRVAMDIVRLGKGNVASGDENAWIGLDRWMDVGSERMMMMKCWGGNAGTRQFVAPFNLSSGGSPPDYKLTWNVGCFGAYNSNVQPVSSSDYDRDTWSSDCVDYAGNAWSWESHGWGWQRNCHCGGFWDGGNAPNGPGAPLCFGVDGACWGDRHCSADNVQVFLR